MKLKLAVVDGDKITLSRKELEEWHEHYYKLAEKYMKALDSYRSALYMGKADTLLYILRCFEVKEE